MSEKTKTVEGNAFSIKPKSIESVVDSPISLNEGYIPLGEATKTKLNQDTRRKKSNRK